MSRIGVLIVLTAVAGCGGGSAPRSAPAPQPAAAPPAPPAGVPSTPLRYRLRGPLVYEVFRHDSLFYESMPGAPQTSGKRAVLTVLPVPGRGIETEARLDSLEAIEDTRLSRATIDSSLGTRWQVLLGPSGPRGSILGGRRLILPGQVEAIVRLLFPQLPQNGLRDGESWTDSASYRVQLDAFEATESASRSSRAASVPGGGDHLVVEAAERLVRRGSASQAGQTMTLTGEGRRRLSYDFAADGWVRRLTASDSLDMVVTINPAGETIPVRWRSTLIARLREAPPR